MKPEFKIIALIALMAFVLMPVQADNLTITMSNPSGIAERDIIVYFANGTMQGFYNSTSVITLETDQSYLFMLAPLHTNPFDDPADWFDNEAVPFLMSNLIYIMAMVFLAAIWLGRK